MIKGLTELAKFIQGIKAEKESKTEKLLEAVHKALVATKKYQELGIKDREKEFELAELWGIASIKALPVKVELSDRFMYKSVRWTDEWEEKEEAINDLDVSIKNIERDIKTIITNKGPVSKESGLELMSRF